MELSPPTRINTTMMIAAPNFGRRHGHVLSAEAPDLTNCEAQPSSI